MGTDVVLSTGPSTRTDISSQLMAHAWLEPAHQPLPPANLRGMEGDTDLSLSSVVSKPTQSVPVLYELRATLSFQHTPGSPASSGSSGTHKNMCRPQSFKAMQNTGGNTIEKMCPCIHRWLSLRTKQRPFRVCEFQSSAEWLVSSLRHIIGDSVTSLGSQRLVI